mmetsp:Transcript_21982/g.38708  ORF Transcript_21982/g.38708 Transcript_21982/m.38708 type:complete len:96 (-) Transcript_21982:288-575(-)
MTIHSTTKYSILMPRHVHEIQYKERNDQGQTQILNDRSQAPLANIFPSGVNANDLMLSLWSSKRARQWPSGTSNSLILDPPPVHAILVPSLLKTR